MSMWRYALAGAVTVGALTALQFGSLSDPRTTPPPLMPSTPSVVAPSTPPIAAPSAPVPANDYQIAELVRQIDALRALVANAVREIEQARQAVEPPQAPPPAQPIQAAVAPRHGRTTAEREALLARLRTRFVDENPALAAEQPPAPEPRERLAEARVAAIEGRIPDAERLLREAQTQRVFRPEPGPPSIAANRIGRALDLLNVGDLARAIQNIDDAARSARMAVIEGRITDAARLLREAQTQGVFRPEPGAPSIAANRIGRALDLLNVGDLTRAIQNIDDAARSAN
jgi:hypothetical protein